MDGLDREVSLDMLARTYGPTLSAYRALAADARLEIGGAAGMEPVARWILRQLTVD